jgi:hypothetical protein
VLIGGDEVAYRRRLDRRQPDCVQDRGQSRAHEVQHGRRGELVRPCVSSRRATRALARLYATLTAEAVDANRATPDYFVQRNDIVRQSLLTAVDRTRECGDLPSGPLAVQVASGVMAVMDGLQLQWLLDPGFDVFGTFDAHVGDRRAAGAGRLSQRRPPSGQDRRGRVFV